MPSEPQQVPPGEEVLGPYAFGWLIGRQGQNGPRLRCPMDLVVHDAAGVLYAISRHQPRVGQWTLDGDFVDDFGVPGSTQPGGVRGAVDGELQWPSCIALAADGLNVTEEAPH